MRCIDADDIVYESIDSSDTCRHESYYGTGILAVRKEDIDAMPTIEPERKKDIIQKFHDYQIDWLKSHYDIELEPQLEEMIVRFLHDTANCYMMETGGEQECKRQLNTATE